MDDIIGIPKYHKYFYHFIIGIPKYHKYFYHSIVLLGEQPKYTSFWALIMHAMSAIHLRRNYVQSRWQISYSF